MLSWSDSALMLRPSRFVTAVTIKVNSTPSLRKQSLSFRHSNEMILKLDSEGLVIILRCSQHVESGDYQRPGISRCFVPLAHYSHLIPIPCRMSLS